TTIFPCYWWKSLIIRTQNVVGCQANQVLWWDVKQIQTLLDFWYPFDWLVSFLYSL
ncbi:hypothetical protein ABKV19_014196, partial [Rosa sericea]